MFGEHAAFILPSYLISAAALFMTTAVIFVIYRNRKSELQKLEQEHSPSADKR